MNKKMLIFPVLIIGLIVFVAILNFTKKPNATPNPESQIIANPSSQPVADGLKAFDKKVRHLHWLSNTELVYTEVNGLTHQRDLKMYDAKTERLLFKNETFNIDTIAWSDNQTAVLCEGFAPYRLYLYTKLDGVRPLPIKGTTVVWQSNDQFFYLDMTNPNQPIPTFFSLSSQKRQAVGTSLYADQSFWLRTPENVALKSINYETGVEKIVLLDPKTGIYQDLPITSASQTTPSPLGEQFAYIDTKGVHIYNKKGDTVVYKTPAYPNFLFYVWQDENSLLIADGNAEETTIWAINIKNGSRTQRYRSLKLLPEQKVQMLLSPDKKHVAIAADQGGLFLLNNSSE